MSHYSLPRLPLALAVVFAVLCPPSSDFCLYAAPLKEASVTRIVKDVRVMEMPSNVQKPAALNQTVRDQQAVITGIESRAELLFTDKTLTRIGANSVFTFKEGTRDMDLKRGTMLLQVPKGAGGAQIKTAAVTAAITGTTLMVEYQPGAGAEALTFAPAPADAAVPAVPVVEPAPASTGAGAVASDVDGTARILVPGETQFRPLQEGEAIPAGSSLMTTGSGTAVVSPAPGVAVRILPNSILRVNAAEGQGSTPKVRLDLKEGGVINMISKAKYEQVDYQVTTPQGVCAARGTVFAVFVSGGKVLVLGVHGASAFNGQPVAAGRAVAFGSGGGSIPAGSPEFQKLLNLTIDSLNRAALQGLIPPSFLPQVRQQLEKGGVKLDAGQIEKLSPPTPSNRPAAPNVAGGTKAKGGGFAKIVVLEGEVRVFITGKLGESMVLGPGQMLIFPPNTSRLPEAVDIDLDLLVKTSNLVQEKSGGGGADDGGLSFAYIDAAIGEQQQEIQSGVLGDTNLIILDGDNLLVLTDDQLQAIENLQTVLNPLAGPTGPYFNPALTGPLTTITGLSALNATTLVSTNPTITDGGGNIYDGRIMTGLASYDQAASKAEYLFGAQSPFDAQISLQLNAPAPMAAFRFASLSINGPFPVVASGPDAQGWLGLVSVGSMGINFTGGPLDLSPLANGMLLATVDGNITFTSGTINVANRQVVFYARDGNFAADYDNSGGNIIFGNAASLVGGGNGRFIAEAQNTLAFNGAASGFLDIDLNSGTGNLDFNGSLQGVNIYLNNEGTVSGTQQILLHPAGVIQGSNVGIDGETVIMNGASVLGSSNVNIWGDAIQLNSGSLRGSNVYLDAVNTLDWGGTAFQAVAVGVPSMVTIRTANLTLAQNQNYSTVPDVKIDVQLNGGSMDGGGFDLLGIRNLAGTGDVSNLGNLTVSGGNIGLSGNLQANGNINAFDAGVGAKGIINVSGDLDASSIYADGNVQAGNITGAVAVTAGGVTSSIITPGTLGLSSGAAATAKGMIDVGTLNGTGASATAPLLKINQSGPSTIGSVFANTIQAANADLTAGFIRFYTTNPANGNIQANSLAATSGIDFSGPNPGNNGFNLQITTTTDMGFSSSGSDILYAHAGGAGGTTAIGGNGGFINLNAPKVKVSGSGEIRADGGFSGGAVNNGGNGGMIHIQSPQAFEMNGGIISVAGGAAAPTGGEGGNGGQVQVSTAGDIKLQGNAVINAAAGISGGVIPMSSVGGTIDLGTTGGQILVDGSKLATSDKTNAFTIASKGGLIKLISAIAYGSPNPSSNRAIQIKNSSDLYAMTNMSGGIMGTIEARATGANGNVEIDASTLRADIIKIGALTGGGNLIIGNSTLDTNSVLKLYGGTTTGNGVIFVADTTLSGSGAKYISGHTVTINNGVSVNVTGSSAQVFTNVPNYTGSGGNGSTTGQFTGSGATTQPLSSAPAF